MTDRVEEIRGRLEDDCECLPGVPENKRDIWHPYTGERR